MKVKAADEVVVGLPCCRRLQQRPFDLGLPHMCDQQRRNRAHDLVLNREHVVERSIVALRPAMGAGLCINELCRNANAIPLRRTLPSST